MSLTMLQALELSEQLDRRHLLDNGWTAAQIDSHFNQAKPISEEMSRKMAEFTPPL